MKEVFYFRTYCSLKSALSQWLFLKLKECGTINAHEGGEKMGKILEMGATDLAAINKAYEWMEKERAQNKAEILPSEYSTITDFYVPFDMHISFFYDTENEKLFVRTYIYASGVVTYEEVSNPEKLVNESNDSIAITWVLLRTGIFLWNDIYLEA